MIQKKKRVCRWWGLHFQPKTSQVNNSGENEQKSGNPPGFPRKIMKNPCFQLGVPSDDPRLKIFVSLVA